MLKMILEFSTFQALDNGEFYFLDELNDDHIIELAKKIKHFFVSQEINYNDDSKWPEFFLMRLHAIYRIRHIQLVYDDL